MAVPIYWVLIIIAILLIMTKFHIKLIRLYFVYIYWFKYPPIIFLVLTVICYVVAVGLEYLKKLIRYDKLVKKVTQ